MEISPPSRPVRSLRRGLRVRGRAAQGHRQPVQGPRARCPHRAGGQGLAEREHAARPTRRSRRPIRGPAAARMPRSLHWSPMTESDGDADSRRGGGVGHSRTGGRMGREPQPPARPVPARPPPGRLRGADRPGRGAGGGVHRAPFVLRSGPGPGHRPRRLGARQRLQLPAPRRAPPRETGPRPGGGHQSS